MLIDFILSSGKKKSLSVEMNRGVFILIVLITLTFLGLSAFSVSYHNKNATNGYRLKQIEQEREILMRKIENLEMQIADESSLSSIDINMKMQYTEKPRIIYVQ